MATSARVATPPPFVRLSGHPVRWQLLAALAGSDYRVRELVARVGEPQNLVSYHLRLLRDAGLVRATRSSFDGRDSYYHLDLDRCASALADTGTALHPALHLDATAPIVPDTRPRSRRTSVLFVCTGNSARSPMAEALLRRHAGDGVTVTSAGTRPKDAMHPDAVRALAEAFGIDIAGQPTQALDDVGRRRFDVVVTLCDKAREACPEFPGHPRWIHWSIPDPAAANDSGPGGGYAAYQRTAVEIGTRVRHLLPVLAIPRKEAQP
jgi:protein-tyrosine-phosphatase/DNA-binding transcriptional ArsR family regulator